MSHVLFFLKRYYPALMSAVLLMCSAAPWNISLCIWISLVPLFLLLHSQKYTPKQKIYAGFFTGLLYFLTILWPLSSVDAWWWLTPDTIWWTLRKPLWMLFIIGLSVYGAAITYALGSVVYIYIEGYKKPLLLFFCFPVVWVIIETIRTATVFGFGWAHIGYSAVHTPHIAYIVHWVGVSGLTFFIVLCNVIIAYTLYTYATTKKIALIPIISISIVMLSIVVGGFYTMHTYKKEKTDVIPIALIATQTQTQHTTPEQYEDIFFHIAEAGERGVSIVVLPENTFPLFILDTSTGVPIGYRPESNTARLFDTFIELSKKYATTSIVVGMHTKEKEKTYNSLVVFERGTIQDIYNKQDLLPIGEKAHITEGRPDTDVLIGTHMAVPRICSEIMLSQKNNSTPASFIINIANNGVFSHPRVEAYNMAIAQMRALEARLPLIHSEKQGASFITDAFGRVEASSETYVLYTQVLL